MGLCGSGKSTRLNIVTRLEKFGSDIVKFKGIDLINTSGNDRTTVRRQEMGIIFQFFELLEGLSVLETLETTSLIYDYYTEKTRKEITELIKVIDLSTKEDQLIECLSRGEKQRVAIARTFINNSKSIRLSPLMIFEVKIS